MNWKMKRQLTIRVLCFCFLMFGAATAARAATRTVDNLGDDQAKNTCSAAVPDDCSFRGAIERAASGDTINFDAGIFSTPQTISISTKIEPRVLHPDLTINGPGANLLTLSGGKGKNK